MGFLDKVIGKSIAEPVEAVGNVLDKLFTSDDERLSKELLLEKLRAQPHIAQTEINKLEAQHRTVFVAGWRPLIGYVCAIGLGFTFLINPIIQWSTGEPGPTLPTESIVSLVISLLGLGTLRTVEKLTGASK